MKTIDFQCKMEGRFKSKFYHKISPSLFFVTIDFTGVQANLTFESRVGTLCVCKSIKTKFHEIKKFLSQFLSLVLDKIELKIETSNAFCTIVPIFSSNSFDATFNEQSEFALISRKIVSVQEVTSIYGKVIRF